MKAPLFYRIAAILMIVFAAGHTLNFSQVDPAWHADAVVQAMQSVHFDAFGSEQTYWDFFLGFGYVVTALVLLAAIVTWQFSGLPAAALAKMRVSAWAFAVCFAVMTFLAWRYFFIMPIVLCGATAVCLAVAAWLSGKPQPGAVD